MDMWCGKCYVRTLPARLFRSLLICRSQVTLTPTIFSMICQSFRVILGDGCQDGKIVCLQYLSCRMYQTNLSISKNGFEVLNYLSHRGMQAIHRRSPQYGRSPTHCPGYLPTRDPEGAYTAQDASVSSFFANHYGTASQTCTFGCDQISKTAGIHQSNAKFKHFNADIPEIADWRSTWCLWLKSKCSCWRYVDAV